jgi:hypothetical protein
MEEVGHQIHVQSYLFVKCSHPEQIEMHHSHRGEISICKIRQYRSEQLS